MTMPVASTSSENLQMMPEVNSQSVSQSINPSVSQSAALLPRVKNKKWVTATDARCELKQTEKSQTSRLCYFFMSAHMHTHTCWRAHAHKHTHMHAQVPPPHTHTVIDKLT